MNEATTLAKTAIAVRRARRASTRWCSPQLRPTRRALPATGLGSSCTSRATTAGSMRSRRRSPSSRPELRVIAFPAWDTVPYDRIGPNAEIVARRITALAKLLLGGRKEPTIVLTTVNAVLQRVPPRRLLRRALQADRARPAHRHEPADRSA